jgi:acyl carrier protein
MSDTDVLGSTRRIVYAAIDALNEQLTHQKLPKAPGTILLGKDGLLDSVGFVNLVVLLEEKCQEHRGVSVSLTDALSAEDHQFKSVESLVDYLDRRLAEDPPSSCY